MLIKKISLEFCKKMAVIIFVSLCVATVLHASPWDDGFQGPVAEPVDCKTKKVRCA